MLEGGGIKMLRRIKSSLIAFMRHDPNIPKLKKSGLRVGDNFHMLGGCIIDHSHCWLISIGNDVTFAPRVHILAHDASTKRALGYTRIARTVIGDRVFVGASAIILPGVTIGSDAIVGAGSVVTKDVPSGSVVAGNPARVLCSTKDYLSRRSKEIEDDFTPVFGFEYTVAGGVTDLMKKEMLERLDRCPFGGGYVV